MDGVDLARKVHEQWPNVLPLITSGGRRPAAEEIADHGHFIAKPYLPDRKRPLDRTYRSVVLG